MEEEAKYTWEINPTKYLEENVTKAIIAGESEPATISKQQKIAYLNELAQLSQGPRTVIRYSIVILDLSPQKAEFRLSRKEIILKHLEGFVNNYFEENPLSQLALIGTNNEKAHIICDFTSSAKDIVKGMDVKSEPTGTASVQSALNLAIKLLEGTPKHSQKDILIIFSSLFTADPGNLETTLGQLKTANIRCSAVSICGSFMFLNLLAKETNGWCEVPEDEEHLRRIITKFSIERQSKTKVTTLIEVGFPKWELAGNIELTNMDDTKRREIRGRGIRTFCACHQLLTCIGYVCPRCGAMHCEIPCHCKICGLLLTTSAHLVRTRTSGGTIGLFYNILNIASYKNMQESEIWKIIWEAIIKNGGEGRSGKQAISCKGCATEIVVYLGESEGIRGVSICPKCMSVFCLYFCELNKKLGTAMYLYTIP